MAVCVVDFVDDLTARLGPKAEAFDGDTVDKLEVIADKGDRWPFSAVCYASSEVSVDVVISPRVLQLIANGRLPEGEVGQFYSASIWGECTLPILRHIKAVERGFRSHVLEGDVGHIAGPSRVSLDEADVIALDDSDVASVLHNVSSLRQYESSADNLRCSRSQR